MGNLWTGLLASFGDYLGKRSMKESNTGYLDTVFDDPDFELEELIAAVKMIHRRHRRRHLRPIRRWHLGQPHPRRFLRWRGLESA